MPSNYQAITEHNEEQLGKDTSSRKSQVSMYSDSTHFVYEILQNADDYGATEVFFKLSKDDIVIEHNGVPFKEENVKAITYFGKSTSREDLVKTGRFGIGFKSVFAFTATPIIISGTEHFQIYGLYCIKEYPYPDSFSRSRTRIILPFDHESKQPDFVEELMSKEEAYRQISECLVGLDMNTLLFTRNIREIRWEIGDRSECYSREDEVDNNARLTTIKDGTHENTYLVFSKIPTWKSEEHKPVEIAFAVDAQNQLAPIHDEFLHVLFPTTGRTDLRFILNGPYRTNPARETISPTDAFNLHLMEVTCELMKALLPKLRDEKYLILQFLSILPNKGDTLSGFYTPLRNTVLSEFRNEKLTPTKRGDYAAASELYRVNTELSDLISDEDLAILLGKDCSLPFKVDEILQRRDARGRFVQDPNTQLIDNFLNTLQIPDWNMTEFVSTLLAQPEMIVDWLGKKTVEWHQTLYALLYDFLGLRQIGTYWYSSDSNLKNKLSDLPIIRCGDDIYRSGGKCFFPSDDVERDERFPRVLKGVYSSGQNDDQKSKARDFLEAIKVRSVDEAIEVEAILNLRYVKGTSKLRETHHKQDLGRFISLVEREPDKAVLFEKYNILKATNGEYLPAFLLFLDLPCLDTGLTVCCEDIDFFISDSFFDGKVQSLPKFPLVYEEGYGIEPKRFGIFAAAVGVKTRLEPTKQQIPAEHSEHRYLVLEAPGKFVGKTSINEDYTVGEFDILLKTPSVDKSRLIWRTMTDTLSADYLQARYRNNRSEEIRVGMSSLVHKLKDKVWIPQKNGDSVSFVHPTDASITLLPEGFPYEAGQEWLNAIGFGEIADKETEKRFQHNQHAKEFGFDSADEAKKAAGYFEKMGISVEESLKKLHAQERRTELLIIELNDAGEKIYQVVPKSTKVSGNTIDPRTALRARYTTDENGMHCQMCSKGMPFKKLNSDEDYFEAVEALGKGYFFKEHEAQYLALCPECAAKYKVYVKGDRESREACHSALKGSDSPQIHLESNGQNIRIWFEEKHWQDLKTVLYYYENVYDPENSDD